MDLKPPVHLQLTKEAQQFLDLLSNLGYLDSKSLQQLYQQLLHLRNHSGNIELDEVKRCTAEMLFHEKETLPKRVQRYLKADWNLLFS
ncbi:MAG: hypothetical protein VX278_21910 [Myxococcota bacterium]|nr:hypothetical protein [Myxococcota bacterium]